MGISGWPEETKKFKTWDLIRTLIFSYNDPMLFGGDFNKILNYEEKEGGGYGETSHSGV